MTHTLKILFVLIGLFNLNLINAQNKNEQQFKENEDSLQLIYIPIDLNDCFNQLDSLFNDSIIDQIKKWTEDDFLGNAHFGTGTWIRNNWGLWKGSRLAVYFSGLGIHHPDDMSSIILTSYHRKLLDKPID